MLRQIIIAIVPTIGPIALLTKHDIIIDNEATTIMESPPKQNARINLHTTSLPLITVTPLLRTIKSPPPNVNIPIHKSLMLKIE